MSGGEQRAFKLTDTGFEVAGYEVSDVPELMQYWRDHLRALGELAQIMSAMQPDADAMHYAPVGPEDFEGLDIAVPGLAERVQERREGQG